MKKRLLMILLVVALLVTAAVFAVQADPTTTPTDIRDRGCPCSVHNGAVPDRSVWVEGYVASEFSNPSNNLHWYLPDGLAPSATFTVDGTAKEVVIAIPEGKRLNCNTENRTLLVRNGATVHLVGEGDVTGKGVASSVGGIIRVMTNGKLYIHDDITIFKRADSTNTSGAGGLIVAQSGGQVTMNGGLLTAPATSGNGGAVAVQDANADYGATKFIMNGGVIDARNAAAANGGAIWVNGGEVTIQGTSQIMGTTNAVTAGGVISAHQSGVPTGHSTQINIKGSAQLTGGKAANGGSINVYNGTLNIGESAVISGGTATTNGGNIKIDAGTLSITGGQINNGVAGNFGGIHAAISFNMENCSLTGNRATGYGGTLAVAGSSKTVNMTNCTIDGTNEAEAANGTHGGFVYIVAGNTLNMSGGSISNCKATTLGGAVYNLGTFSMTNGASISNCSDGGSALQGGAVYAGGSFTMTGSSITGCSAKQGGAIYIASGKTVTMTNGSITGCTATDQGGAVFVSGGTFNMAGSAQLEVSADSADKSGRGVRVVDGTVTMSGTSAIKGLGTTSGGYGIDICAYGGNASLTLSGSASVYDEGATHRRNILIQQFNNYTAKLNIASGWEGNASAYFNTVTGDNYGQLLPAANAVAAGAYTGDLRLENNAMSAGLFADGTQLRVSGVSVKTKDVEGYAWYPSNAAAVTAADNNANKVIKLYTGAALALDGKTVYVDFNGQTVNVTGEGTLYGIDTATGFTGDAAASATGVAAEPFAVDPLTGITYVAKDGHFYPIQVKNDSLYVNPSNVGIYFNAVVEYNPAIADCITGYGIDATLDENFDGLYLTAQGTGKPTDDAFYGYVSGIMGTGLNDAETGITPVRARLWVKLANGGEEQVVCGAERAKSLKDAMIAFDGIWEQLGNDQAGFLQMYKTYYTVMSTWGLNEIDEAYQAQN